jgi:uncharacterized protein YjiS (DUF1127 family)
MRTSTQSQYLIGTTRPDEGFGRIARSIAVPRQVATDSTRSANEADITLRDESEALALRSAAANGFGDAAVNRSGDVTQSSAIELHAAARAHRSRRLGQSVERALRLALGRLRQLIADMQRGREEQATYRVLAALDARTLRDVGLDRSEIRSVARELADRYATRVHALQSPHERS